MVIQDKGCARGHEDSEAKEANVSRSPTHVKGRNKCENRFEKYQDNHKGKCFYANVRSLVNRVKMAELEMYIKNECPDIIGLTETWASDKISNEELKLVGYDMFRKDREMESTDKHKGGGVLF